MDEAAIAARLQLNLPKPEVAPDIERVVKEVQAERIAKPTDLYNDLSAMKLLDYFAVSKELRNDQETLDQLRYIHEWAAEQVGDDSVDVMTSIRELEGRLGLTFRQDEKLQAIYRWIKLDNQRRKTEKEMALI